MTKAACLMLLLSVSVAAQSATPSTSEPTTGTISGKVVNETGQPMAGASAFIRAVNSAISGRTTVTDVEGNFSVGGLEPALYTVAASAPAYTSISDPNAPPSYYRIGDSVRLELVRGGVITGTVTNAAGEPLVALRVRATMVRDAKGVAPKMFTMGLAETTTDDRGIYRMYGLAPGTYVVSAGGFGIGQSFQFSPYESDLPTYAPSATRDNAAEVSVRGGEESNVDIRYRGEPGYSVSGTVKSPGANGSAIMITPAGGTVMPFSNTFQPPGSRGFAFHGIADGEYDVVAQEAAQIPGTMNPLFMVSEPKRVTVKGASVTGIELIPKPLASISGRFVFEASKIPECQGKRAPLLTETLLYTRRHEKDAEKENSPYVRLFGGFATLDSKGDFTLRNLSPGRLQFEPRFYARYWYVQSITIGSAPPAGTAKPVKSDVAGSWTTVKHGDQITNLTITLAEGAASIRGRLTAAELPSGALVYLLPAETTKADDVLRFFVSEIGGDGTFVLQNLPPGKYWIVQTPAEDQTSTLAKLRQPEAATARAKLRKIAEAQKLEIELKPCQNLNDYELKL